MNGTGEKLVILQISHNRPGLDQRGLTLVEVTMVLAVIPIVLGIAYGALTVGARAWAISRDIMFLAGEASRVVEQITADARGARQVLDGSDDRTLRLVDQHGDEVEYAFSLAVSDDGSSRGGTIRRNGLPILHEGAHVLSCVFTYYGADGSPVQAGSQLDYADAAQATGVEVSLSLGSGTRTFATRSFVALRSR